MSYTKLKQNLSATCSFRFPWPTVIEYGLRLDIKRHSESGLFRLFTRIIIGCCKCRLSLFTIPYDRFIALNTIIAAGKGSNEKPLLFTTV